MKNYADHNTERREDLTAWKVKFFSKGDGLY